MALTHAKHCPVATATALPPELPPADTGSSLLLSGFLTGPWIDLREWDLHHIMNQHHYRLGRLYTYPIPNSSMLVLPATIAPACWIFWTTVAAYGLIKPFRIAEAHVVGSSVVQMLSLTAIKFPSISDLGFPSDLLACGMTIFGTHLGTNRFGVVQWLLQPLKRHF